MGRYLQALREDLISLDLANSEPTKPTDRGKVGFVGGGRAESSVLEASLTRVEELRRTAAEARDWADLDAVLDAAQAAYDAGEASQEEVEDLAGCVGDRSRQVPDDASAGTLGELLRSQPVVRVHSRMLGETVVWIAEGVEMPDTDEVVYSEHELRRLAGKDPETVRAIHQVKKALDGEVVGDDRGRVKQ